MTKLLNLGCGQRYHKDWTNIDFVADSELVITHDLRTGIPFPEDSFDAVYHSHILEHFGKSGGGKFLAECYRVLKHGGIIRVAVPDLEQIVKEYSDNLEKALAGDSTAEKRYDWILLEMFDQMSRDHSGGEMAECLADPNIGIKDFIQKRIGSFGEGLINDLQSESSSNHKPSIKDKLSSAFKISSYINLLKRKLGRNEREYLEIGKFRLSGEVHRCMYDRFSLGRALKNAGFREIVIRSAFDSYIIGWTEYNLDAKDDVVYKPDSLYMEAVK